MQNEYFKKIAGLDNQIMKLRKELVDYDKQIDAVAEKLDSLRGAKRKELEAEVDKMVEHRLELAGQLSDLREIKNEARRACVERTNNELDILSAVG